MDRVPVDIRPGLPAAGLGMTNTRSAAWAAQNEQKMGKWKKMKRFPVDISLGLAGPIFWPLRATIYWISFISWPQRLDYRQLT